jgi:hypothetical protein
MRFRITLLLTIASLAATAAVAAPARASDAAGCPATALSQPFAPWLDPSQYGLVAGGDFESVHSGWSLDGASVADDNEPWTVNDQNDHRSLSLGADGSATSPVVCLGIEDPTLRFFVRNDGSPLSTLLVSATYDGADGSPVTVPLATVTAGPAWQPSQQVPVLLNLLSAPVASDGSTYVRFAFTAVGDGGSWSVDDVYLDPFKTK